MKMIHLRLPLWRVIMAGILALGIGVFTASCAGSGEPPAAVDAPAVEEAPAPAADTPLPEDQDLVEHPEVADDIEPPEAAEQPDEPASSEMIDACSLVTKEEVEAALGMPVGETIRDTMPFYSECTYKAGEWDYVELVLYDYDDEESAASFFHTFFGPDDEKPEEFSVSGYPAYENYPLVNIMVLIGQYELRINISDSNLRDQEAEFQKAKELAEIALSRMP